MVDVTLLRATLFIQNFDSWSFLHITNNHGCVPGPGPCNADQDRACVCCRISAETSYVQLRRSPERKAVEFLKCNLLYSIWLMRSPFVFCKCIAGYALSRVIHRIQSEIIILMS
jgi:hypothetical protein